MRQFALALPSVFLATFILVTSVIRISQPKYDFGPTPKPSSTASDKILTTKHFLWPLKALADKVKIAANFSHKERSEDLLAVADNRLAVALELFYLGEIEDGVAALTKAEKYLEEAARAERIAHDSGEYTADLLQKLSEASLEHIATIDQLLTMCPDQACPVINSAGNYPRRLNNEAKTALLSLGSPIPQTLINQ